MMGQRQKVGGQLQFTQLRQRAHARPYGAAIRSLFDSWRKLRLASWAQHTGCQNKALW